MANIPSYEFAVTPSASNLFRMVPAGYVFGEGLPVSGVSPIVSNFTPSLGGAIVSGTTLQFDVTVSDSTPLQSVAIGVRYDGLSLVEFAYDGTVLTPNFELGSVSTLPTGLRFQLKRRGGWPASPKVFVLAVTEDGAENS